MTPSPLLRQAASRLVIGFDGTSLGPDLTQLLDAGVGGVILFRRNVVDPWQVASLVAEILRAANRPLFVSVDQEGGPVQRLRSPFTEFPPHGVLGGIGDLALTKRVGAALAAELSALGFNMDFAPVADVNTNPKNPVIGIRSFGSEPEPVASHVAAFIDGMQGASVMACAKHFPGHGDTSQDSHFDLPELAHDLERIRSVELLPFRKAIEHRVASIMTAHVVFESLDPGVPATLSRRVLTGLLREEMGYQGLIVSDDLEMKAIAGRGGVAEAAVRSVEAGADLLLVCKTKERIWESMEALARRLEQPGIDAASESRITQALQRYPARIADAAVARKVVGSPSNRMLAEEISAKAKSAGIAWAPSAAVAASPVSTT